MSGGNTAMTPNEYQFRTEKFSIYPDAGKHSVMELFYLALGLASEAGEVAGKVKKFYRDGVLDYDNLCKELGDVQWYLARIAGWAGFSLEEVMHINLKQLDDRQKRGVIGGSGDNR